MSSYEMIGNAIQNGFAQMSQVQKQRGDAYEGMFRSALAFRQQQQDAYFKQKGLELDEKRLALDSEYKNNIIDSNDRELQLRIDEAEIRRREREDGLKNKTAISSLHGIRVSTGAELSSLEKQIDFNNKIIEAGTKQLDLYGTSSPQDYFGEKGKELKARIEKAQKDNSDLASKRIDIGGRFDEITGAIQAIGSGADPQSIIGSLNLSKPNRDIIDSSLLEPRGFKDKMVSYKETGNPLFGDSSIIPQDPITPDKPMVKLGTNDVLKILMNEKANDYAKKQAVALADDSAKKYIKDSRDALKYDAAISFVSSIGWNLPKELINRNPNAVKQIESSTKAFKDLQGDESDIGKLIIDSQRALSDIRNDPSVKSPDGNIIVSKVQDKFEEWVRNEINPNPITDDESTALSPTGQLKASNGASINFGIDKSFIEKRGFKNDNEIIIPDKYETRKDEKVNIDVSKEFSNRFIKDGEFDKQSFANWVVALDDKSNVFKLDRIIRTDSFVPSGDFFTSDSFTLEDVNNQRKILINEIVSSKDKALEFFKKYGR